MDARDIQQWDTLTAEAAALVERLYAAWCDASARGDYAACRKLGRLRAAAQRRWQRRVDAWAVAAYGEGVK